MYVDNVCRYRSVCTAHEVPEGARGVYGATRLKQHSHVFSSSYRVLQANFSIDRNKDTVFSPLGEKTSTREETPRSLLMII